MVRRSLASPIALLVASVSTLLLPLGLTACDRTSPIDSVPPGVEQDAGVWLADAKKISATLPRAVGSFVPTEGADPHVTSYSTGPVFGSSCVYADGARQLVVRIESGNIRARASMAMEPDAGSHAATVHGVPALIHWSEVGRMAQVTFVLSRRYLVELRLVPASSESEAVRLAEAIDFGPLQSLRLDGVRAD
jgi:hypothetical protein